jgi:hypothetical protein
MHCNVLHKGINLNCELLKRNIYIFTVDIDWASEDVIKYCIDYFENKNIPLTVFLTHKSKYLVERYNNFNFDFGLHPNFLKGSSHGNSFEEVIEKCICIKPNANFFRCHRYFDCNDITYEFSRRNFLFDSNLCTLLQDVKPFIHRAGLIRFPVYFEDGAYLEHGFNLNFNEVKDKYFSHNGIKVINIHPIQIMLNTCDYKLYRNLTDTIERNDWVNLKYKDLYKYQNKGRGIETFVNDLVNHIIETNAEVMLLKDVYKILEPYPNCRTQLSTSAMRS